MTLAPTVNRNGQHPAPTPRDASLENIEAEQNVLGSMLIEAATIDKMCALLRTDDFCRPENKAIFDAIVYLHDAGAPIELLAVTQYVKEHGGLEKTGGLPYLTSLFDTVSSAANIEYYAGRLKEYAHKRTASDLAEWLREAARNPDISPDDIAKRIYADADRVTQANPSFISRARQKPLAQRIVTLRNVPDPPAILPYLFGPYLTVGDAHVLTGQTGIGKSTFLYNVLPALAEGRELWGIPCKPVRVLYVDMENGDLGRSMKAQRLFQNRADRAGLDNLLFLRESLNLSKEEAALLAFVQAEGVELIVFDTVRRCFPVKDENDNAEVYNRIVPILDALKAAGVASLLIAHPSKANNGISRGAGALADAVDTNLSLTMHGGEVNDADGVLALRVTKGRLMGLTTPDLLLRRVGDDKFERVDSADAGVMPTRKNKCQVIIIDFLAGGQARYADLSKIVQAEGFSKPTFDRALRDMKANGDIHCPATGIYTLDDPFADDAGS